MADDWYGNIDHEERALRIRQAREGELAVGRFLAEKVKVAGLPVMVDADFNRKNGKDAPDISVTKQGATAPSFYVEVTSSVLYSFTDTKAFKKSHKLLVESNKIRKFRDGYRGAPVAYAYRFADGVIRFYSFSDMADVPEREVNSFGGYSANRERSKNHEVPTGSFRPLSEILKSWREEYSGRKP